MVLYEFLQSNFFIYAVSIAFIVSWVVFILSLIYLRKFLKGDFYSFALYSSLGILFIALHSTGHLLEGTAFLPAQYAIYNFFFTYGSLTIGSLFFIKAILVFRKLSKTYGFADMSSK